MDSRRASLLLVVLLLITDWGHTEEPGDSHGGQIFVTFPDAPLPQEEDSGPHPLQDTQARGSLLRSLIQAMRRSSRSQAFLFQPQRFGRNSRGSWSNARLSPRVGGGLSSPFWSLAAPQRFGKK